MSTEIRCPLCNKIAALEDICACPAECGVTYACDCCRYVCLKCNTIGIGCRECLNPEFRKAKIICKVCLASGCTDTDSKTPEWVQLLQKHDDYRVKDNDLALFKLAGIEIPKISYEESVKALESLKTCYPYTDIQLVRVMRQPGYRLAARVWDIAYDSYGNKLIKINGNEGGLGGIVLRSKNYDMGEAEEEVDLAIFWRPDLQTWDSDEGLLLFK